MAEPSRNVSALVAGSTGLVGRECVDLLLGQPMFSRIIALVRRPLGKEVSSDRLRVEQVDYDHLEEHAGLFRVDAIFCALGTTMGNAGSEEAFRRVDFDYPLAVARLGLVQGAQRFLLVSALGAGPGSRIFYNRVKGELEEAISALGYPSLTIVRPSLLLGERAERKTGTTIAGRLAFLFPRRFRPVQAAAVARALVEAACGESPGKRIIHNRAIR